MKVITLLASLLFGATTAYSQEPYESTVSADTVLQTHAEEVASAQTSGLIADVYHAGSVLFPKGGSNIAVDGTALLDSVAAALSTPAMADVGIVLTSHASADGSPERNQKLTAHRAAAVIEYLVEVGNISEDRISSRSYGDSAPLVGVAPRDPQQRRVEVYFAYRVPPAEDPETLELPDGLKLTRFGAEAKPFDAFLLLDLDYSDPDNPAVPLDQSGTIEFWVRPAGTQASETDRAPVLMALHGGGRVKLSIQMPKELDRLTVWDGSGDEGLATVEYVFAGGAARHVALATHDGRSSLYIDGKHRGTFDIGYGEEPAQAVVVGALNTSNDLAFEGDIGGLRLWRRALGPDEIAKLPETTGDPTASSPVYDDLLAYGSGEGSSLAVPEPVIVLETGSWTLFGSENISAQNKSAYTTSAIFSDHPPHQKDASDSSPDPDVRSEQIAFLKEHMDDPERAFTSYPLYTIRQIPPDRFGSSSFPVPGFAGEESTLELRSLTENDPATGLPVRATPRRLSFRTDEVGFKAARITHRERVARLRQTTFPGDQVNTGSRFTGRTLKKGQQIVGVSGHADTASGRIVSLTVYADDGPLATWSPGKKKNLALKAFSQFLPAGVPFSGFRFLSDDEGYMTSIGITGDNDPVRAAITVTLEDGRSERFERTGRNAYQSTAEKSILTKKEKPVLTIVNRELIEIDGVPIDLVPVHPHAPPKGETSSFDNVFIVQAKAVNLESSYESYDITAMDPIHMTESGTDRRVFAMPDPGGSDYYDANRIFIPSGLHYVPEFTGQQHSKTHVINSMSDFQNANSHSVSAGGSVGPVAFSRSESHKNASRVIRGKNRSMTMGISKAMFYDLVLDKARMKLDRQFVSRIERLKTKGSKADYDRFVEAYGTHYPTAVIYGGMGVLQMEYSGSKIGRMASSETDIAYSAKVTLSQKVAPAGGGSPTSQNLGSVEGGLSNSSGNSSSFEQEMGDQFENFYFVGGAHAGMSKESWGVGLDGVVPVHVSLQPLEGLLAPPFFDDPIVLYEIRPKLKAAIARYIGKAEGELGDDVNTLPRLYELTLVDLKPTKWILRDEDEVAQHNQHGGEGPSEAAEGQTDFLELGGTISVDSGLASEHEEQRKRLYVDLEQPRDFTVEAGISNLDVRDPVPFARPFTAADSGDGSLSHVFAVDPCVVELGGTFEIDIDLREYDQRLGSDPYKRTVRRNWTSGEKKDQDFAGGLKKNQFAVRVKSKVKNRPEIEGCDAKSEDVNECPEFELVFNLEEIGTTLGKPADDPVCPATLAEYNRIAEQRLTGGE